LYEPKLAVAHSLLLLERPAGLLGARGELLAAEQELEVLPLLVVKRPGGQTLLTLLLRRHRGGGTSARDTDRGMTFEENNKGRARRKNGVLLRHEL
jgi:hypothetical protein